jgi:DNA-binding transcriptional MerR regulator
MDDHRPETNGYGAADVCRLVGISHRQLEYWVLIGVVCPTGEMHGSKRFRRFTDQDVLILKRIKLLTDEGFLVSRAIEKVRRETPEWFNERTLAG